MEAFFYRVLAFMTSVLMLFTNLFPAFTEKKTDFKECKNVIMMIGDGMGFNSIKMAEQYLGKELTAFDSFELHGESKTSPANPGLTTDSAAGGTALATGVRVSLDSVAVYPSDLDAEKSCPMNLCELAVSQGKAAGVVTTAKTWDATPAAFSSHVAYRKYSEEIHRQQMESGLTLLWGMRDADLDLDLAAQNGFEVVWTEDEMNALDSSQRSFGQFGYDFWIDDAEENMPTLSEMTDKAIDLLDDDEDGFFLMIEAAHIDKCGHDKEGENMSKVMEGFDKAIKVALDYAKTHGDTMVVLTADHETGGIINIFGEYRYTLGDHTPVNVPLYVYGCDNFIEQGEAIENREVARRAACVLGEKNFPIEVKK